MPDRPLRVAELVRQFFYLAFLMRRPQDVHAGEATLPIGVGLALLSYVLALVGAHGVGLALARAVIDIALTGGALWVALKLTDRVARFRQAYGGYCGAVAFINLAAIPVYLSSRASLEPSVGLADFVLLVWNLALLGHVIRHTFETKLPTGILCAFVYVILLSGLLADLVPIAPV